MSVLSRGILLATLQMGLLAGVAAKFWIDRSILPHVWVRTIPVDPDSLTRGRYISLRIALELAGSVSEYEQQVKLSVENDRLVARVSPEGSLRLWPGRPSYLAEPIAFFIPEHVPDPSIRAPGEELWAEVTVPKKGPPRPIRLGVKKAGVLTPMPL